MPKSNSDPWNESPFIVELLRRFFLALCEGNKLKEEVHNVEERQGEVDWGGSLYGLQQV